MISWLSDADAMKMQAILRELQPANFEIFAGEAAPYAPAYGSDYRPALRDTGACVGPRA
jgi:hypothetical protein